MADNNYTQLTEIVRRANLFNVDPVPQFVTFSNYGESMTGTATAVNSKIYPSAFICLYINNLNTEDKIKSFIKDTIVGYYENKLAIGRDAYKGSLTNTEQYIKPLDALLNAIELFDPGYSIKYISDIVEQDYNGIWSDFMCSINLNNASNEYKYVINKVDKSKTKDKEDKIIALPEGFKTFCPYNWAIDDTFIGPTEYSNTSIIIDGQFSDINYNYSNCTFFYNNGDECTENDLKAGRFFTTLNFDTDNNFQLKAQAANNIQLTNWNGKNNNIALWIGNSGEHTFRFNLNIEKTNIIAFECDFKKTTADDYNIQVTLFKGDGDEQVKLTDDILATNELKHISVNEIKADTLKLYLSGPNKGITLYNIKITVKTELNEQTPLLFNYNTYINTITREKLTENLPDSFKFNVLIPLYDRIVDNPASPGETSSHSLYLHTDLTGEGTVYESSPNTVTDKSETLYNTLVPYGMWFSGTSPITLYYNTNTATANFVQPTWTLTLSSQFKPFPYSNQFSPATPTSTGTASDENTKPELHDTFAQVLARQNQMMQKLDEYNRTIASLQNEINLLKNSSK